MKMTIKAALATGLAAMVVTTPLPVMATTGVREHVRVQHAGIADASVAEYRRRYGRDRRLDVDAGDVILGIGLIAAIAAIAGSASKDRAPKRDYDNDYRGRDTDERPESGRDDVSSAVRACTDAAEGRANDRVDEIGSVVRDGNGWQVTGTVGADNFTCEVNDGRVEAIRFGDREI